MPLPNDLHNHAHEVFSQACLGGQDQNKKFFLEMPLNARARDATSEGAQLIGTLDD